MNIIGLCMAAVIAFSQPMTYIEAYVPPIMQIVNFDGCSYESEWLYRKYVSKEPEVLQQALIDYGAVINVAPNSKYVSGTSAGTYYSGTGSININCSTNGKMKIAVNHEIGHCMDEILSFYYGLDWCEDPYSGVYCKFVSNCDEFRNIFEEECKYAGYPSWNSWCPAEYFAETYRYVIEGNETMMNKAPRATAFVKRVLYETYNVEF